MFLFQQATPAQQDAVQDALNASQAATNTIADMIRGFWAQLPIIAVGIVVFVIFLFIASIVRRIIQAGVSRVHFDVMLASLLARMGYFITIVIGFFVASVVVFPGISPGDLIAGLGIGSVALGFAFKDVLQNLFAGFLILLYRPFHIGDQIKVNDFEGTVEDINVRATKIKTYDGERVVMPNSELYMNAVLVRTAFPQRRVKFTVGISYEEDIEQARETIMNVLRRTEGVLKDPMPEVDVVEFADSSVNLKALFWSESVQSSVRKTSNKVASGIKKALDEKGIEIPYPHRVFMNKANDSIRVENGNSRNGKGEGKILNSSL